MTRALRDAALFMMIWAGIMAVSACASNRIPVDRETVAAHEITDIPWPWCTRDELLKCPMIRQGSELFMLPIGGRVGDGADVWDVRGVVVDAFSEGE